ncbi:MAG: TIGR02281 family clan AA aspartic protease [Gammaproteobacteria bacterium]|nr:TIGR02281 family clan AA aspartic protease [Gammaproteobacteria bacterium]MDD9959700.1 TIGR02281 family clan AA aspartic protease [Gammaproteobacteria bacterium]
MSTPVKHAPGKNIGQGMLIASFSLGLFALTLFFDDWLGNQSNPNQIPDSSVTNSGVREVILERNRQGHYVANGEINGIPVTFLLDTGATDVAIPSSIADTAGLSRGMAHQAATANGVVTVFATQINELKLGNILLYDIDASVTPSMPGNTILLGMSALRQIEFTQRGSFLTLRQLP